MKHSRAQGKRVFSMVYLRACSTVPHFSFVAVVFTLVSISRYLLFLYRKQRGHRKNGTQWSTETPNLLKLLDSLVHGCDPLRRTREMPTNTDIPA